MTISPYRSAMWCGCQGVRPARVSTSHGPANSNIASTVQIPKVTGTEVCRNTVPIQPVCATRMNVA